MDSTMTMDLIWPLVKMCIPAILVLAICITARVLKNRKERKRRKEELDYLAKRIAEEQNKT